MTIDELFAQGHRVITCDALGPKDCCVRLVLEEYDGFMGPWGTLHDASTDAKIVPPQRVCVLHFGWDTWRPYTTRHHKN